MREYERRDLTAGHPPIVAINAHSADPHYAPSLDDNLPMRKGDFLLVDMWSKRKLPHAVYDDITWTFFIGDAVPSEHQKIFNVVRDGRDAAIKAAQKRYPTGEVLYGWQIDEEARQSIKKAGYGEYSCTVLDTPYTKKFTVMEQTSIIWRRRIAAGSCRERAFPSSPVFISKGTSACEAKSICICLTRKPL